MYVIPQFIGDKMSPLVVTANYKIKADGTHVMNNDKVCFHCFSLDMEKGTLTGCKDQTIPFQTYPDNFVRKLIALHA
jgi:hypothetical protein